MHDVYAERARQPALVARRAPAAGDVYAPIPPRDVVHRVRSTCAEPSVSVQPLTNDAGCVWRHANDQGTGAARAFGSGDVRVPGEGP